MNARSEDAGTVLPLGTEEHAVQFQLVTEDE